MQCWVLAHSLRIFGPRRVLPQDQCAALKKSSFKSPAPLLLIVNTCTFYLCILTHRVCLARLELMSRKQCSP